MIYAAKSSPDDKDAIPTQIAACRDAIEREGDRQLADAPFSEANVSAFRGERGPELESALASARRLASEHGSAELWVWHSSRLARGSGEQGKRSLLKIWADAKYEGVTLRSAEDDSQLSNAVLVAVQSDQNHRYSADLSVWVKAGRERQFLTGRRMGGPVPDGLLRKYKPDGSPYYVRDPERAPIIERAFELSAGNLGDGEVARRLNEAGYRTRGRKDRAPQSYTRRQVQDMLTNQTYCGRVVTKRGKPDERVLPDDVPTNIEPLISREEFDAIQDLRRGRDRASSGRVEPAKLGKRGGRPTANYVLSKIAVCARCGGNIYCFTAPYKRVDGSRARTYVCREVHAATGVCDAPQINAEPLDALICASLDTMFDRYEQWLDLASDDGGEADRVAGLVAGIDAQIASTERTAKAAQADYEKHLGTSASDAALSVLTDLRERIGKLQGERAGLDHQLASLRAEKVAREPAANARRTLAVDPNVAGMPQRVNDELRRIIIGVTLDKLDNGQIEAVAYYGDRGRPADITDEEQIVWHDGQPLGPDDPVDVVAPDYVSMNRLMTAVDRSTSWVRYFVGGVVLHPPRQWRPKRTRSTETG